MSNNPKVSIIIVNYNGYEDTIECLQSLRHINYSNYEIIVVDNASTDDSAERLKEIIHNHNNEILLISTINGGFSAGNNIGMKYALDHQSDFCLLLNNDTVVEPDFLKILIEPFGRIENCGLTIGKIKYESQREIIWYAGGELNLRTARTAHWHYREQDTFIDNETEVSFATGCCMCLSRNAIETIGLMNEDYFMYVEDVEYCIRLKNAGLLMLYTPSAIIYHKVNASSESTSSFSQFYIIRNKLMLIQQCFQKSKNTAFLYTCLQSLYRCFKGEYDLKTTVKAYKAYKNHEVGKSKLF